MIDSESILGRVVAIKKNGRPLRLDRGRGRIINEFLGFKNYVSYRFDVKINVLKGQIRDKPGFQCLRTIYLILKKHFNLLNRVMVKIFIT